MRPQSLVQTIMTHFAWSCSAAPGGLRAPLRESGCHKPGPAAGRIAVPHGPSPAHQYDHRHHFPGAPGPDEGFCTPSSTKPFAGPRSSPISGSRPDHRALTYQQARQQPVGRTPAGPAHRRAGRHPDRQTASQTDRRSPGRPDGAQPAAGRSAAFPSPRPDDTAAISSAAQNPRPGRDRVIPDQPAAQQLCLRVCQQPTVQMIMTQVAHSPHLGSTASRASGGPAEFVLDSAADP